MVENRQWMNRLALTQHIETNIYNSDADNVLRQDTIYHRRSGNLLEWSGESVILRNDEVYPYGSGRFSIVNNDDYFIRADEWRHNSNEFGGFFSQSSDTEVASFIAHSGFSGFLDGVLAGISESNFIADAFADLELAGRQVINDFNCYIIENETDRGHFTAWVSPELNYNIIKLVWHIKPDHLLNGTPLSDTSIEDWKLTLDNIEYEQIDGIFIPTKGRYLREALFRDGRVRNTELLLTRQDIDLDPDFDELNAFAPKIPEGTVLRHKNYDHLQFEWRQGQFIPYVDDVILDELHNEVLRLQDFPDIAWRDSSEPDGNATTSDVEHEDTTGDSGKSLDDNNQIAKHESPSNIGLIMGLSVAVVLGIALAGGLLMTRKANNNA